MYGMIAARMDRWQAMKVFVKVAETESFAAAGRQMHMSPPAVMHIVSSLEAVIGTRLLTRTTRSVKLTEAKALDIRGLSAAAC